MSSLTFCRHWVHGKGSSGAALSHPHGNSRLGAAFKISRGVHLLREKELFDCAPRHAAFKILALGAAIFFCDESLLREESEKKKNKETYYC